tara:strand:+ start:268 stop:474 length:207 start_codon:yes stop_codon:yes gene_type:complete
MKLSHPLPTYSVPQVAGNQFAIEQADAQNHKRERDIEVGDASVILTSANGTRYKLVISDAGVLSTSAA